MMKLSHITYILIISMALLSACREDIELDLKNDTPKLVVEAEMNATTGKMSVLLSKSNGFYDEAGINHVDDAQVKLALANGDQIAIPYISNGRYEAENINVNTSDELVLEVVDGDGKTYEGKAIVPRSTAIDSVQVIENTGGFGGGDDGYYLFVRWQDQADEANYYRLQASGSTNEEDDDVDYNLISDEGFDGDEMTRAIFDAYTAGQVIDVKLVSINYAAYEYLTELSSSASGGFNASTPFNPESNINNGALGYFRAVYVDTQEVVLPE